MSAETRLAPTAFDDRGRVTAAVREPAYRAHLEPADVTALLAYLARVPSTLSVGTALAAVACLISTLLGADVWLDVHAFLDRDGWKKAQTSRSTALRYLAAVCKDVETRVHVGMVDVRARLEELARALDTAAGPRSMLDAGVDLLAGDAERRWTAEDYRDEGQTVRADVAPLVETTPDLRARVLYLQRLGAPLAGERASAEAELARREAAPVGETMACGLGYVPKVCEVCGWERCDCGAAKVVPAPGDGYCNPRLGGAS